jgi:uncharacterized protein with FMN-binding domain
MAKKMPKRLVAMSASAIATIYFAGLLATGAAADNLSVATTSPTVAAVAQTTSTGYQDGTYSGTGSGRFGSITVAVTTAGGAITSVQITKVATTFPVSQIASLPAQVVKTQSANVNTVTGATASSQAFKQAIQQALVQASAATSATATA